MSGSLFIISLALLVACSSAFMYLPPHETSWAKAESSVRRHLVQNHGKREQMETMSQSMGPADLAGVYNYPFNQGGGRGMTVAVTIYGNCTYAESDLAIFNQRFGLPTCTFANGCLSKITSNGDHNWPADNTDWDMECSLDIQQIHATAPGAKILIVTSGGSSTSSVYQALMYAGQHANYVSASWGGNEVYMQDVETSLQNAVSMYGVSFFAATGDNGGQTLQYYPAASSYVTAVGGTSVSGSGLTATETAWSGSGGGCSTIYTPPIAQFLDPGYSRTGCGTKRAVPDLSFDADPNASGIWTYTQSTGWILEGGTSAAAPRAAGRAALHGVQVTPQLIYGGGMQFRDIISGSNGAHQAGPGLDLVTGKGSWIGLTSGHYATPRPFPTSTPTATPEPPRTNGPEGCGN